MNLKEFYEEKAKPKIKETYEKAKNVTKVVIDTFKENPMLAVMAVSSIGTVVTGVASAITKNREENDEACTTYDPYAGANLMTTHELTNSEILEMTDRMKTGQTKGQALNDMGLLRDEKRRR